MGSLIGWLDSSSADAERARQLLGAFDESDTVDPLGLGSVRDSFSELLFPGVSTVQTRGRYFLFVPWIFQQIEAEHVSASRAAARNRQLHIDLLHQLTEHDERDGVIGRVARDKVKLLPSSIYWNGLLRLGVFNKPWSMSTYVANLDALHRHRRVRDEDDDDATHVWHPDLPPPPDDFPNGVTLDFAPDESAFLAERIQLAVPDSMFAWLLQRGRLIDDSAIAPWAVDGLSQLPETLGRRLQLAETFSNAVHGLQLRYNLDVAELVENDERAAFYRNWLDEWIEQTGPIAAQQVRQLDRTEFWSTVLIDGPRIGMPTRRHVTAWFDALAEHGPGIVNAPATRELVRHRELETKGRRARLWHRDAREKWGGASAASALRFRWNPASTIINDIIAGGTNDAQS